MPRLFKGLLSASILSFSLLVSISSALAYGPGIDMTCRVGLQPLPVNNGQVLAWKASPQVPNGWKGRANVQGVVSAIIPDRNCHDHFIIQIGPNPGDTLEVVYNDDFGDLPPIQPGMRVSACGDFIKSIAQNGPYPPSPAGAIVHWVHMNPHGGHEQGYLIIDNVMYGTHSDQGAGRYQPQNSSCGG